MRRGGPSRRGYVRKTSMRIASHSSPYGRSARSGPAHPHERRVQQLSAVADSLRGDLRHRNAVARLPAQASARGDSGVSETRTAHGVSPRRGRRSARNDATLSGVALGAATSRHPLFHQSAPRSRVSRCRSRVPRIPRSAAPGREAAAPRPIVVLVVATCWWMSDVTSARCSRCCCSAWAGLPSKSCIPRADAIVRRRACSRSGMSECR